MRVIGIMALVSNIILLTVSGVPLCDVAVVEVACAGGTTAPATFSAGIAFAPAVTVALTGDAGSLEKGHAYPLVYAPSLAVGGTVWTVTGLPPRQRSKISATGGMLSLTLVPKGSSVIFR